MNATSADDRGQLPTLCTRLSAILREQETELTAVTAALRAERTRFITGRGEDLLRAEGALQENTARCLELDRARATVMQEIAAFLGTDARRLRAVDLAAIIHGQAGDELARQARRTRAVAEELQVESRVGGTLLAWSARCHEGLLRRLAQVAAAVPTYDRHGNKGRESHAPRLLDAVL